MVPYIFNEDKDLVTKFDGFTYYSNVPVIRSMYKLLYAISVRRI